jgi:hypothetical protein
MRCKATKVRSKDNGNLVLGRPPPSGHDAGGVHLTAKSHAETHTEAGATGFHWCAGQRVKESSKRAFKWERDRGTHSLRAGEVNGDACCCCCCCGGGGKSKLERTEPKPPAHEKSADDRREDAAASKLVSKSASHRQVAFATYDTSHFTDHATRGRALRHRKNGHQNRQLQQMT